MENSNGVILKNKYNQIQLKPYIEGMSNSDQENTGENQSSGDVSGKEDTQNLDLWNLVLDEILEKFLYHIVQSSVPRWQTCKSVRETCRRWSNVIVPLEEKLLLRIHIHPSNVLPNPTFKGKVKVSVRKMISSFGVSSGICKSISQHIGDRKWKSAWLVLRPDEHSWFIMERVFWKNSHTWWVKNDKYNLTKEEKDILLDDRSWLNDNLMDAAQKLICKSLDNLECYQSVWNSQKKFLCSNQGPHSDYA